MSLGKILFLVDDSLRIFTCIPMCLFGKAKE